MIRESDINSFFTWCINTTIDVRRTKDKYIFVLDLINTNLVEDSISVVTRTKVECLQSIIKLILKGNSPEGAVSNVINVELFAQFADFLDLKLYEDISAERFEEINKDIEAQSKYSVIVKKVDCIHKLIDRLAEHDYEHIDEAYDIFSKVAFESSNAVNRVDKYITEQTESRVKVGEDDLNHTLSGMLQRYDRSCKIPTGFAYLDDKVMIGGFERNRLYTFAGSSGSGKSTLLANMALNAAKFDGYTNGLKEKYKLFLYITLENDKEESLGRIICAHFGISDIELKRRLMEDPTELAKIITEDISKNNAALVIEHFDVEAISATNIGVMIDGLIDEHGGKDKCIVPAVYLDYLDLLKSDGDSKETRIKLANITQELKTLARDYHIPVITATQLNRDAYRVKTSFDLNAALVAESIDKVNISDFVALLAKNQEDLNLVHFRIGKFRSGNPDVPLDFKVNFEHFKFVECKPTQNKVKREDGEELPIFKPGQFSGLGDV